VANVLKDEIKMSNTESGVRAGRCGLSVLIYFSPALFTLGGCEF
jgi:hypothetical protein